MTGPRPRESIAEKRAKKAEVDDPEIVLAAGLRFLEARPRSVAEVRKRLTQAGYRDELVTATIEKLADYGMLDDEAFATQWVESRDRAHPRGEHALMLELRQKGIEAPIVAAVLKARRDAATRWDGPANAEPLPQNPDEAAARKLLTRHARALERVTDPRARRQRAYALLARNGFSPDVASTVAREADAGASPDASSDE